MRSLAQRVLFQIRREELLKAGDRVGVAVSGGIDSVALLRLLLELRGELGIVLSVVHFNHKLRGAESDADEEFVACLAREFDLEFYVDGDDVAQHAADGHVSVEAAARELRYGFFRYLLGSELDEERPSGAEAQSSVGGSDRRAGSAAPLKSLSSGGGPQGIKPDPGDARLRGAEAALFHGNSGHDSRPGSADAYGLPTLSQKTREWWGNHVSPKLNKILTGHMLDDQAETVLMRMIRGAGVRGLGAIYPRIAVEDDDGEFCGEIIRPLLGFRRRELEQYLRDIGQAWREDSTNGDDAFTRNRVRKLVLPLLEKEFNPAVAENLAELAEIARGEEDYWENEVAGWMGTAVHWSEPEWAHALPETAVSNTAGLVQISSARTAESQNPHFSQNRGEVGHPKTDDLQGRIDDAPWLVMDAVVDLLWFLGESLAVQRRLVKAIGEQAGVPLEFRHVEEILRFASDGRSSGKHSSGKHSSDKELSLPLGWTLARTPDELIFKTPDLRGPAPQQDYEYELLVPGQVMVRETGSTIEAQLVPPGVPQFGAAGYNPDQLLDAGSLPGPLRVRNWRPGDRFWPAHTKSPKKIKELLQERQVAQPERKLWPVVVSGEEIVWMRGFPAPAKYRVKPGQPAILITEKPFAK